MAPVTLYGKGIAYRKVRNS